MVLIVEIKARKMPSRLLGVAYMHIQKNEFSCSLVGHQKHESIHSFRTLLVSVFGS